MGPFSFAETPCKVDMRGEATSGKQLRDETWLKFGVLMQCQVKNLCVFDVFLYMFVFVVLLDMLHTSLSI